MALSLVRGLNIYHIQNTMGINYSQSMLIRPGPFVYCVAKAYYARGPGNINRIQTTIV